MKTKAVLELAEVKAVAAAAEAEALANQWAVSIAIVDDGGHLLWLQRLDGAAPISAQIAPAKANTAALGRRESRSYEEVINGGRYSFLSAPGLQGMLEGGVPILKDGQVIGAPRRRGPRSLQKTLCPLSCRRDGRPFRTGSPPVVRRPGGSLREDQLAAARDLQQIALGSMLDPDAVRAAEQLLRRDRALAGGAWSPFGRRGRLFYMVRDHATTSNKNVSHLWRKNRARLPGIASRPHQGLRTA